MFSLESPNAGDSYEYTQYHFQYKKANHPKSAAMGFFPKGLKNQLKPLKVFCISELYKTDLIFWVILEEEYHCVTNEFII